jgi:hypothetical protein
MWWDITSPGRYSGLLFEVVECWEASRDARQTNHSNTLRTLFHIQELKSVNQRDSKEPA